MNKTAKEYSFKKFTDSYIMMHKGIPKFLFWIIVILGFAIVGIITWSAFVVKPYVVKAQSIVTVADKTYITTAANGNIKALRVIEGQKVIKGEILIIQETLELDAQIAQVNVFIGYYELRHDLYGRLIEYIQKDYGRDEAQHSFDKSNITELEFYNYMSGYESERAQYGDNNTAIEALKIQTLNVRLQERASIALELEKYISQRQAYEDGKEAYVIRANSNGIVHLNGNLHTGLFIQAGSSVGTIVNENDDLILECYLTTADRAKVKEGNVIKFALAGLSQNEYGTLSGTITRIDKDVTATDDRYFFKAEIRLDKTSFHSQKNNVELMYGLQGEARIICEETTYLKYFLEQVGIKIRR